MQFDPENSHRHPIIEVTPNRRELYGVLAAAAFAGSAAMVTLTDIPHRLERQNLLDRISSEIGQHRRSAVSTLVESIVLWAGNMKLANLMDSGGIMHGTHAAEGQGAIEFAERHPVLDYLGSNFMKPLVEEAIFRLAPSSLFAEEHPPNVQLHWDVGLTANVIFSVIHNFGSPEPGKFKFTLTSLPLEQFILGAYCWHAQRRGGFAHAVGAHVLYNNLCVAYEMRQNLRDSAEDEK